MFRNRIINGNMAVDQRGSATTAVTASGSYAMDRFQIAFNTPGTVALSQAATPAALTGFQKCAKLVGTGATTSAAGNYIQVVQNIEGLNLSDMMWGTAAAQAISISFWVYGPAATYAVSLRNGASNRSYVKNYTISAANTWQQISFSVAGDQSGTWAVDNSAGLSVQFTFGCGSTYQTTADVWQAGTYSGTSSTAGLGSNTVYITGVQVEKGPVATPFEVRPYPVELQSCQRYYQKLGGVIANDITIAGWAGGSGNYINTTLTFPVQLRAPPSSYNIVGTWTVSASGTPGQPGFWGQPGTSTCSIYSNAGAVGYVLVNTKDTTTYVTVSAEI